MKRTTSDTCAVGSNANCASCDPNRAAEGADDADNNCATCNNGYSLTNNKKCVLTSNAGRAVDANSGKSNNLEHVIRKTFNGV